MPELDSHRFEIGKHLEERSLLLQIKRAARALARHYDEVLRPFKLTNGQFLLSGMEAWMCPECIVSIAAVIVGSSSIGGVAALLRGPLRASTRKPK